MPDVVKPVSHILLTVKFPYTNMHTNLKASGHYICNALMPKERRLYEKSKVFSNNDIVFSVCMQ